MNTSRKWIIPNGRKREIDCRSWNHNVPTAVGKKIDEYENRQRNVAIFGIEIQQIYEFPLDELTSFVIYFL